tara:strand:+ start:240 stop:443 length:204 start_codon:yes stop_codon:yes gene_type:complete
MAQRLTEMDHLRAYIRQLLEHSKMLGELVAHVEEDIPRHKGTKHLWATVDEANDLIAGPTRAYVDQD